MTDGVLIDNDILLKVCTYGLAQEAMEKFLMFGKRVGCLGVARYVIADRLKKTNRVKDCKKTKLNLAKLYARIELLEPNEQEVQTASEFEAAGLKANVSFDVGESLLAAIFIHRSFSCFATGDKRALLAAFKLDEVNKILGGRYLCFEQLLAAILTEKNYVYVRDNVCAEDLIDKASTICFACSSDVAELQDIIQGLDSYIRNLNKQIAGTLVDDQFLRNTA